MNDLVGLLWNVAAQSACSLADFRKGRWSGMFLANKLQSMCRSVTYLSEAPTRNDSDVESLYALNFEEALATLPIEAVPRRSLGHLDSAPQPQEP